MFVLALAASCTRTRPPREERPVATTDIGQLSRDVGLTLPAQARVVGVKRTRGPDDAIFAKVEVTPEDWSRVLSGAPFAARDLTPDSRGYLEPDEGWWDPSAPQALKATQVNLAGGRILNVGVDESRRPAAIVLYLMNHGT
jgi:hypothetical protein